MRLEKNINKISAFKKEIDLVIIFIIAFFVTIGFVYAKFDLTLSEQKKIILHVLHDRTQELELYLNNILEKAEEKIRYISFNTNANDNNDILFEKDYLNEISIGIIDENKLVIKSSDNFDQKILESFLDKTSRNMYKIKNNQVVWYYGGNIKNQIIATAKDSINKTKVIFIINLESVIHNVSHLKANPSEYFRNFNIAIIDKNKNLAVASNEIWFNNFNKDIIHNFFLKGYERKARIYQLSGHNYLLQNIDYIPFSIITSVEELEVMQDTIKILFVRTIEIVGALITFMLLILLIFRDRLLKQRLTRSYECINKAMDAKSEFLNFVAHEVKSPLSCILTTTQLLERKTFGNNIEDYSYYINAIDGNCKLISEFIDDLLMEELVIKGKFNINLTPCDINIIIERAIEINNIRYAEKNIEIINSTSKTLPLINCDKKRMLQIFNNILSNAMKFSANNTKITIYSIILNDNIKICFQDQGSGMSSEQIYSLLNKSNNINITDAAVESHGIGFNIIKILAKAHNIEILINSKIDVGTTVTLLFEQNSYETKKVVI